MDGTRRALIAGAVALLSGAGASVGARAAGYPERPIRLVVPFPPGGPTDIVGRLVAAQLSEVIGQQVIVDNKAGAGGNVGTDIVAKSKPDGYTLLLGTAATHGINVSLYQRLEYDPVRDFAPIALTGENPMVLLVPPGMPHTVKDLVAKLKSEPGKWSYASSGNGTTNHLGGELFKKRTGIDVMHVPYRGSGPALQDLLAGRVAFMFDSFGTSLEYVKSGKLQALGVMAAKRSVAGPDVPTMAEAGLPDFIGATWNVVVAPAGTPQPIVDQLNAAVNKALKDPKTAQRMVQAGIDTVDDSTPASTAAFIKSEIAKWRDLVKLADAKVD
jgi:tripartite-type tricarboxylate transporter receptor subunit TctC